MVGSVAITKPMRQPLLDGARALLALGFDPAGAITARHAGDDTAAMRGRLSDLSKWTVEEADRGGLRKRLWMPRSFWGGSPETADDAEAGQLAAVAARAVGEAA